MTASQPRTNQTTFPSSAIEETGQEAAAPEKRPEGIRSQSDTPKTVRFADETRLSSPLFFPIEAKDRAPTQIKLPDKTSHEMLSASRVAPAQRSCSSSTAGFPNFTFKGLNIRQKAVIKTSENRIRSPAVPTPSQKTNSSAPAGKENVAIKGGPLANLLAPTLLREDAENTQEVSLDVPRHMSDIVNSGRYTINFNINLSGLSSKDFKLSTESKDLIMARDCLSIASRALKDKSRDKSRKDQIVRKRNHDLNSHLSAQKANTTKILSELKSCRQELSLQVDEVANLKKSLENSRLKTAALKQQLKQEKERAAVVEINAASHIANLENIIRDLQASLEGLRSSQLTAKLIDPLINASRQVAAPISPVSDPKLTSEHPLQCSTEEGYKSPDGISERSPSVALRPEHMRYSVSPRPFAKRRRVWRKRDFAVVVPTTKKTLTKRALRSNNCKENDVFLYEDCPEVDTTQSSTNSDTEDSPDVDNDFDEIIEDDACKTSRPKPKNNEEAQQLFDDLFGVPKTLKACLDGTRLAFKDGALVSLFPSTSLLYSLLFQAGNVTK